MKIYKLFLIIAICCFGVTSINGQSFKQAISLNGLGDPTADAKGFGIAYNPNNQLVYASITGSFSSPNNAVAVINPATDSIIATFDVGLFPEDIAFIPGTNIGAITNSTSGTVSIFEGTNTSHQVIQTVQLPDSFGFGTCYPFGITFHEGYWYVSTVDGSGEVYAIDTNTYQVDLNAGFSTEFRLNGRMVSTSIPGRPPQNQLLVGTTIYNSTFTGATAGIYNSNDVQINYLINDNFAPSTSDFAQHSDGRIFVGGLFEGNLFVCDAEGNPLRTIDCNGFNAYGLGLSEDESLLVMCDLYDTSLAFVDVANETFISDISISALGYGVPNDAVFALGKLYVSDQGSENVLVFDQIPSFTPNNNYAGDVLISNPTPKGGELVTVTMQAARNQMGWLIGSNDDIATNSNGISFLIGPNLNLYASGLNMCRASKTVPNNPAVIGRQFHFQGVTYDANGSLTTTAPRMIIIQ